MSQDTLKTKAMVCLYHTSDILPNQCDSCLTQTIDALLPLIWSLVRQFTNPQTYKQFVKSCYMVAGDGITARSAHKVMVISGLLAQRSCEQLDLLDDKLHVMVSSIIRGDHRLVNFRSMTTLHADDREGVGPDDNRTTIIESYVVDVPKDSNKEDTQSFAEMIIGCNLRSLAKVSEIMACDFKA